MVQEPEQPDSAKARKVAERREELIESARRIAETDGWAAVTVRRLADEIGWSQPVIYSHFPKGITAVVTAVALRGFAELAGATRATARRKDRLGAAAGVYLDFARANSGLYEAMFSHPTELPFGDPQAPVELREAFAALQDAVVATLGPDPDGIGTEIIWSTLHGLSVLERDGRIPVRSSRARVRGLRQLLDG